MNRTHRLLLAAGAVSLAAWLCIEILAPAERLSWTPEMLEAARLMDRAVTAVRAHCDSAGIAIDERIDPNRTGLIGPELTPLMTTLGDAAAKRTTAVPDLAALILYLLRRAGTARGDTVAVGLSASFPALLPAVLAACRAGGIHPVVILSLGASGYGATREDLTLLDIHTLLLRAGVFEVPPAAVSLGGTRDVGAGFEPGVRDRLRERIAASGFPTFLEDDLEANVRRRLEIYGTGRISAFINAGGSWANLGTSPLALRLRPGLNDPRDLTLPPPGERGVLFALAARGVPVIHLLFIRGLALHHGLPWDPVPLPGPGTSALRDRVSEDGILFWIVSGIWLAAVAGLAAVGLRGPRSPGSDPSRSSPPGDPPAWEPVGVSGEREVRAGAGRPGG